jgi:hypothetical protein
VLIAHFRAFDVVRQGNRNKVIPLAPSCSRFSRFQEWAQTNEGRVGRRERTVPLMFERKFTGCHLLPQVLALVIIGFKRKQIVNHSTG